MPKIDTLDWIERIRFQAFANGVAMGRRFNTRRGRGGVHRLSTARLYELYLESENVGHKVDRALKGQMP